MKILVQGATLKCTHQGTAPLPGGSPKLKIDGKPVVVAGMEAGAAFAGCTFSTPDGPSPCTVTGAASAGVSVRFKVDGMGVLLDNASGPAINAKDPSATWSVDNAGQALSEET